MVTEEARFPLPLATSKLARGLQGLYEDSEHRRSTSSSSSSLRARVLDAPPPTAHADDGDALLIAPRALRARLHARAGSLISLNGRPACARAWEQDEEEDAGGADVALTPLLAHNLGLLQRALFTFLAASGGGNGGSGGTLPSPPPPLLPVDAETLVDAGWEDEELLEDSADTTLYGVASAVRIRRVAVPTTTPLLLTPLAAVGTTGEDGDGDGDGEAPAAPAADDASSAARAAAAVPPTSTNTGTARSIMPWQ